MTNLYSVFPRWRNFCKSTNQLRGRPIRTDQIAKPKWTPCYHLLRLYRPCSTHIYKLGSINTHQEAAQFKYERHTSLSVFSSWKILRFPDATSSWTPLKLQFITYPLPVLLRAAQSIPSNGERFESKKRTIADLQMPRYGKANDIFFAGHFVVCDDTDDVTSVIH